jgi:hypothetical protein
MTKANQQPRYRLTDITANLPSGYQGRIARWCGCRPCTVSNILNGKQTQNSDLARKVIRLAESMVIR